MVVIFPSKKQNIKVTWQYFFIQKAISVICKDGYRVTNIKNNYFNNFVNIVVFLDCF